MVIQTLKYITPLMLLLGGFYYQDFSKSSDSIALARSGCLIVFYGVLLESLFVIRATNEGATIPNKLTITAVNDSKKHLTFFDYLKMVPTHYGLIWVCIGTLVWGYGDLVK